MVASCEKDLARLYSHKAARVSAQPGRDAVTDMLVVREFRVGLLNSTVGRALQFLCRTSLCGGRAERLDGPRLDVDADNPAPVLRAVAVQPCTRATACGISVVSSSPAIHRRADTMIHDKSGNSKTTCCTPTAHEHRINAAGAAARLRCGSHPVHG